MSFDGSRFTFNPWNDFSGVVMQQGRVQLDSDWNEWLAELTRRIRAGTLDTVGQAVYPATTPDAFRIQPATDGGIANISIGVGRMYVDGLLAENHGLPAPQSGGWIPQAVTATAKQPSTNQLAWDPAVEELVGQDTTTGSGDRPAILYTQQPYYRNAALPTVAGPYLFYLDVWQREVTFLEDPDLIEKAVAIDTTGRLQTVWQVKYAQVKENETCSTLAKSTAWHPAPSAGRLTTGVVQSTPSGVCCLTPNTGFTGQENQLYRVEIHQPGNLASGGVTTPGAATFKWSRDNASVATGVTAITQGGTVLTVQSTGKDSVLRFSPNQWVEITDDFLELNGLPGELHQVTGVDDVAQTVTLSSAVSTANFPVDLKGQTDPSRHTRLTRWYQGGKVFEKDGSTVWVDLNAATSTGAIPVPPRGTTLILENGITVSFDLDLSSGTQFNTGDFWTFAARAVDGTVENLVEAPAAGIYHHYARLAVVTFPLSPDSSGAIIATPSVNAPGSGYAVDDVLTIAQSGSSGTAQVNVTSVSGTSGVTGVSLTQQHGTKYETANGVATTGGKGTGCTLNIITVPSDCRVGWPLSVSQNGNLVESSVTNLNFLSNLAATEGANDRSVDIDLAKDIIVDSLTWGNDSKLTPDQGGSIELGSSDTNAGIGTPYIDFHFTSKIEDFNTRIINDFDRQLSLAGKLRIAGRDRIDLNPNFGLNMEYFSQPAECVIQAFDALTDKNAPGTGTYLSLNPNGGNVGIGTTSPGFLLEVAGSAAVTTILGRSTAQNANDTLYLGTNDQNFFVDRPGLGSTRNQLIIGFNTAKPDISSQPFQVYNNATDQNMMFSVMSKGSSVNPGSDGVLLAPVTGNVGIRTTSPGHLLEVAADATIENNTTWPIAAVSKMTPSKVLGIGFDPSLNAGFIEATQTNVGYNPLLINPHGAPVGIGTKTTPRSTLEVLAPGVGGGGTPGPIITLTNSSGGPGATVSLDFNTFPNSATGAGYNPSSRIEAVDDGKFVNDIVFLMNKPGGPNQGLTENLRLKSDGEIMSPNLRLKSDGHIVSPMWNVKQVFNDQAGPLPTTGLPGSFPSGGGILLIFASGSGFLGAAGQIGMEIVIDGVSKGFAKSFTNEAGSHKAFTTNALVVSGIPAAATTSPHTLVLKPFTNPNNNTTVTDFNDFFSVTVLELPIIPE